MLVISQKKTKTEHQPCEKNRNEKKMQFHADKYNCIIFNQAVKKIWDNTSFASSSNAVFGWCIVIPIKLGAFNDYVTHF